MSLFGGKSARVKNIIMNIHNDSLEDGEAGIDMDMTAEDILKDLEKEASEEEKEKGGKGWLVGGGVIGARVGLQEGDRFGSKMGLSKATRRVLMDAADYVEQHNIPPAVEKEMVEYFKQGVKDGTITDKLKKMPEFYKTYGGHVAAGTLLGTGAGVAAGAAIRNARNKKDDQKKEANEMSHGLIKIAEEEKKKAGGAVAAGLLGGVGAGKLVDAVAGGFVAEDKMSAKLMKDYDPRKVHEGFKTKYDHKKATAMAKEVTMNLVDILGDSEKLRNHPDYANIRKEITNKNLTRGTLAGGIAGLAGAMILAANDKGQEKKANTVSCSLIKIAKEEKEKKNKEALIGAGVGAKLGGTAGALAVKKKADKEGLHKARGAVWDRGIEEIANASGAEEKLVKNVEMNKNLMDKGILKSEKAFKNTRNKYMAGAMGLGTLAGAGAGFLTGKGVEKTKDKK
jgi:hypothetical protein